MRFGTTMAASVLAGLLLVACGTVAEVESEGPEIEAPDAEASEPEAEPEPEADDLPDPEPEAGVDTGSEEAVDPEADATDAAESASRPEASAGPEPDAQRVADPCASHEGREMEAFIDLVSPVEDQVASGTLELVGCSNVYEATVVWTLLDGDGRTLDEGFTTAECGSGCVGAFRETIDLDAATGEPVAYLQVFSPNASDEGPEQLELTEVIVVIG